jgi:hypothetical protein
MSSSMSRSKVKWTGVALSAMAAGILLPAAAKAAGSLSVSLDLSPLGTTPATTNFLTPGETYPVYVYATVTGSSTISSSEIDGLEYLYYNINNATVGTGGAQVVSATLNPKFVANGSQVGIINPSAGVSIGGTNLTSYAKPRTNVIVNSGSSSVSFLVETLQVQAPGTATTFAYSTPGNLNETTFSLNIPSINSATSIYYQSNYFTDLTATPGTGKPVPDANTNNNAPTAGASVTLVNDILGDLNDDGQVSAADFNILAGNFGQAAGATYLEGDLNGDGQVSAADFNLLAGNFGQSLGVSPAGLIVAPTAQFGTGASSVPEPASLGLLLAGGIVSLVRRRSR